MMTATGSSTADREIVTSRMLDAPRELVYLAWTDPAQLIHWYGPDGFRTTIQEMDVRVGGRWKLVLHGPDGTDFQNLSVFTEVVPPERLAYDHLSGPRFHATVTFEAVGQRTRLTMRMVFPTAEDRAHTEKTFGAVEGARQTLGRLDAFLASRRTS